MNSTLNHLFQVSDTGSADSLYCSFSKTATTREKQVCRIALNFMLYCLLKNLIFTVVVILIGRILKTQWVLCRHGRDHIMVV